MIADAGRIMNGGQFQTIKQHCLRTGTLYEDREFPANNSSLLCGAGGGGRNESFKNVGTVQWKRPNELVRGPRFVSGGVSRFDVIQGKLGNCWFIAAVATLTQHPSLFEQVVPRDNSFEPGQYCGAFHFRFWQYGDWVDVTVDDKLPCDRNGELLFMCSEDRTEFWSALLEKAYAKLHGSYESLSGGVSAEALQDFSGGIVETIYIKERGSDLFDTIKKAFNRQSLMSCALTGRSASAFREEKTSSGLVRGHAYSITRVKELMLPAYGRTPVQLIRVRNPWGNYFEWNGPWSDKSREWNLVDSNTKAGMGVTNANDGEFWISIADFRNQFTKLEICHLSPDPVDTDVKWNGIPWNKTIYRGAWIPGQSAGGCLNYSSFATNPQYFLQFEASDVDGDAGKCTVVVSLVQKCHNRYFSRMTGVGAQCIGFRMFQVPGGSVSRNLDLNFFRKASKTFSSGPYIDSREVSERFEVPPGTYCIVPTTYEPSVQGEFLLRVFSEPQSAGRTGPPANYGHQRPQQQAQAPVAYPSPYQARPQQPQQQFPPQYAPAPALPSGSTYPYGTPVPPQYPAPIAPQYAAPPVPPIYGGSAPRTPYAGAQYQGAFSPPPLPNFVPQPNPGYPGGAQYYSSPPTAPAPQQQGQPSQNPNPGIGWNL